MHVGLQVVAVVSAAKCGAVAVVLGIAAQRIDEAVVVTVAKAEGREVAVFVAVARIADLDVAAKIKAPDDFDDMELRARSDGIALRVIVDVSTGWLTHEMKIENRVGSLDLERDHDKVPKHKEPDEDDPWADEDEIRVFVAKGIFVEGDDDDVNESLATLAQLPAELSSRVLAEMEHAQMSSVRAHSDELTIRFDPNVDTLPDPVTTIHETVTFMKAVSQALSEGDRDMASEPKVIIRGAVEINGQRLEPTQGVFSAEPVQRVSCSYCSTQYVSAGPAPACPNCGAPLGR